MSDLNAVSLYSGAGGLDFGIESAGFRVRTALEFDHDACETIRANRNWSLLERDVHATTGKEILEAGSLHRGDVDLLVGGPPCQPFSKAGYWANGTTKGMADPRAATLPAFMRMVEETLPTVFLLENVHGIAYSGKEEGFETIRRLTMAINRKASTQYALSWKVLNAVDYGVPQLRSRFFLIGHREGRKFIFPGATHTLEDSHPQPQRTLVDTGLLPAAIAWDAIGGLEPASSEDLSIKGSWAELLPSIPEGQNYLWHTDHGGGLSLFGWRTRYWSFLLKLAKNRPSWTIPAQPGPAIGPLHWANRYLSIAELAALQTFPKSVRFVGSRHSIQRQIGNAVPSLLAEVLGREIRAQFFGYKPRSTPRLSVALRRPIPGPEPVLPVPAEFRTLIGHHPAHPGTSKRPSARLSRQQVHPGRTDLDGGLRWVRLLETKQRTAT
jgi:DNA (cytosine-5)-methyltransferase 1